MTLADAYHDEQGRPITPAPAKSPRVIPGPPLEPWQETLRARAAARADARALGPLANTPQARAAFRRDELIRDRGAISLAAEQKRVAHAALGGAEPDDPAEIRAAIDAAFSRPLPPLARASERTTAPAAAPEQPPAASPTQSPAESVKSQRRREGARKAAATVRARRKQRDHDTEVNKRMNEHLDSIGRDVLARQAAEQADAEEAAANPGIPTYRALLANARAANAEAELYRQAHIARAPRQASAWSPMVRHQLHQSLNQFINDRQNAKPKGARE